MIFIIEIAATSRKETANSIQMITAVEKERVKEQRTRNKEEEIYSP